MSCSSMPGDFREAELRALLGSGEWPARNPDRNIADLKAQIAACARGAGELRRVAGEYGPRGDRRLYGPCHGLCRGGGAAADRAAPGRRVQLRDGQWRPGFGRDPGGPGGAHRRWSISPARAISSRTISTRLIRSAGRRRSTCSAPWSTIHIPLNDGCMRPIALKVPEGSMLNPAFSGRGGGGECRDQPGDHRLPVRRLRARWRRARGR